MSEIRVMQPKAGEVREISCASNVRLSFDFSSAVPALSRKGCRKRWRCIVDKLRYGFSPGLSALGTAPGPLACTKVCRRNADVAAAPVVIFRL